VGGKLPRLWLRARPTPRSGEGRTGSRPAPLPRMPAQRPRRSRCTSRSRRRRRHLTPCPPQRRSASTGSASLRPAAGQRIGGRLAATTVPIPPATRLVGVGLRRTRGRGSSPTAPCRHVPPGSGCWLTSHGCMAALARKGHPRPPSSGPASPAPDPGDVGLGSSKVAAGKEPAAPALGRCRPQLCPGPLPASVLRPCGLGSQPHPSPKEGRWTPSSPSSAT
jgi:hypothetical protein